MQSRRIVAFVFSLTMVVLSVVNALADEVSSGGPLNIELKVISDKNYYFSIDIKLIYNGNYEVTVNKSSLPWASTQNMNLNVEFIDRNCEEKIERIFAISDLGFETIKLRAGSELDGTLNLAEYPNLKHVARVCPLALNWKYRLKDNYGRAHGEASGRIALPRE